MRQEVIDLAVHIAKDLCESVSYGSIVEQSWGKGFSEEEQNFIYNEVFSGEALAGGRIERLRNTVRKLSNVSGIDLSELIDEGYLTEDDLG